MNTDILIIGAGPTGLMLANQLNRFGIDFIVIDHKTVAAKHPFLLKNDVFGDENIGNAFGSKVVIHRFSDTGQIYGFRCCLYFRPVDCPKLPRFQLPHL